MKRKIRLAVILISIIGIAAFCYFIWVEYNYSKITGYTEDGEYVKALQNIGSVPDFYRDIKQLKEFENAGLAMGAGNWDQAKQMFSRMGTYRNADKMMTEVDYARANADLNTASYDQAKKEFLALGDYRDAKKLSIKTDYLKAKDMIDKKDYSNGLTLLKTIKDDPDAADLLNRSQESVYMQSVQDYINGHPDKTNFSLVAGYKDADKYATLIKALTRGAVPYEKIVELSGFANTYTYIMSEYILYYLNGQWVDDDRNVGFSMRETAANWEHWKVSCSLMPGTDARAVIMGKVLLVGDYNSWKYVYAFDYVSMDEMIMTDVQTGSNYHMQRIKTAG
ncbi:MAG: hypothetical protein WCP73_03320 [Eubacteriales bacterium]